MNDNEQLIEHAIEYSTTVVPDYGEWTDQHAIEAIKYVINLKDKQIQNIEHLLVNERIVINKLYGRIISDEKKTDEALQKCRNLLRRFLPKDESEWDKIIQLTQTEKDAMEYFRGKK